MSRAADLEALLAPVVVEQGCELWGLEYFQQGRRSALRLYIDAKDGITVDDCERVSRQVSAVLDVEDPIAGAYMLEVSSPGMDRPLFRPEQFLRYVGALIAVRLRAPYEGRRKFQGVMRGIEEGELILQVGDTEYLLPMEGIDKANVVPVFDDGVDSGIAGQGLREGDGIDEAALDLAIDEESGLVDENESPNSDQ
jgi:ribosome maturation factor RimP